MKSYLLVASTLLLSLPASGALAECKIGTQTNYTDQDRSVNSAQVRQDLRQLRQAAIILKNHNRDEACQKVTDVIVALRQRSEAPVHETTDTAQKRADATPARKEHTARAKSWEEQSKAYSANAKSISQTKGRVSASNLIGADLVGTDNDTIGEIDDVVMTPDGKATYVVVSSGGFLGFGETQTAVPYNHLKVAYDNDGSAIFFLPMTEDQLSKAPHFKRGSVDWVSDENWREKNDQYYRQVNHG
jgi:sporulation protein YlmC with PRC-barrel domain